VEVILIYHLGIPQTRVLEEQDRFEPLQNVPLVDQPFYITPGGGRQMRQSTRTFMKLVILFAVALFLISCNPRISEDSTSIPEVATPTATSTPSLGLATEEKEQSVCDGLSGQLLVEVLIGPAEAVGLEPIELAVVDFSASEVEPYLVLGSGASASPPQVLTEEWGTYTVSFDMNFGITGVCQEEGDGHLLLDLTMDGNQLVVVEAEGFHGEYPWAGSETFTLDFPLQDGYEYAGEGWKITLIL
jgi:hypothetical protein